MSETTAEKPAEKFEDGFKTKTMFLDKRPIAGIEQAFAAVDPIAYRVGLGGVTLIELYGEPGNFSMIPYIAVYKGLDVALRAPAQAFIIRYREGI